MKPGKRRDAGNNATTGFSSSVKGAKEKGFAAISTGLSVPAGANAGLVSGGGKAAKESTRKRAQLTSMWIGWEAMFLAFVYTGERRDERRGDEPFASCCCSCCCCEVIFSSGDIFFSQSWVLWFLYLAKVPLRDTFRALCRLRFSKLPLLLYCMVCLFDLWCHIHHWLMSRFFFVGWFFGIFFWASRLLL